MILPYQFKIGQTVIWNSPSGGKRGIYKIIDTLDKKNLEHNEWKDPFILIEGHDGKFEVFAHELSYPLIKVLFRKDAYRNMVAVFPEMFATPDKVMCIYEKTGWETMIYSKIFVDTVEVSEKECESLVKKLRQHGIGEWEGVDEVAFRSQLIDEYAWELAQYKIAEQLCISSYRLFEENNELRKEYNEIFLKQYNASRANLLLIAGYEDDGKDGIRPASVTDKIVCAICGNDTIECERTVNPNTMRSIDYDERVPNYGHCKSCGRTIMYSPAKVCRQIHREARKYVKKHGREPEYALCRFVRYGKNEGKDIVESSMVVKLKTCVEPENERYAVGVRCDGVFGLKTLVRHNDKTDFVITRLIRFHS